MRVPFKKLCLLCLLMLLGLLTVSAISEPRPYIDSREDLGAYLRKCAFSCAKDVSFSYGSRISAKLHDNAWLSDVMFENGIDSATYINYESEGYLAFKSITYLPEFYTQSKQPICWFSDFAQIADYVESMSTARSSDYVFFYDSGLDLYSNYDKLSTHIHSSGVDSYNWEFSKCRIHIYNIVYDEPFAICKTENDVRTYMAQCAKQGVTEYSVYCGKTLYQTLSAKDFARLSVLEAEIRMQSLSMSYSDIYGMVHFSDIAYAADAPLCATIEQAAKELNSAAEQLKSNVTLFCSGGVYNSLLQNNKAVLEELLEHMGAVHYYFSANNDNSTITLTDITYRPGKKMLIAYQTNNLSLLTDREYDALFHIIKTLNSSSMPNDLLGAEKWIHDYLCETIVYTIDDNSQEDDCAIGAILNGKANCDGYADAFYLIGNLVGIEVGYQTGYSRSDSYTGHAWNTIRINGKWYLVDVTWDDSDNGTYDYIWFNLGNDIAARIYRWNTDFSPYLLASNTENSFRVRPIFISKSMSDLKSIISTCKESGYSDVDIYYGDGVNLGRQEDDVFRALREAGLTSTINYSLYSDEGIISFTEMQFD